MATPTVLTIVELDVQGMTCASCAARIEKKLNRLDGVHATVNYATERATVHAPASVGADALIATIERTGYHASVPAPDRHRHDDDPTVLRRRLLLATTLSLPVVLLSMVAELQFPGWQWLSFALTLPVVFWAGWPFHRAAGVNLRHGAATMDTLISVGTLAALGWSTYALLTGPAGAIGFTHAAELRLDRHPMGGTANLYLEVAVGVTTLILLGRWFESRAKRRSGAALRALLELGAAEAAVLVDGAETVVPADQLRVGDRFVVRPGEKFATDGTVVLGHSAADTSLVTGEPVPVELGPGDAVVGGCLNTSGRLEVEATRIGADTQLAQIARLVEAAQMGKA